jgi:hypothetical protein
LWNLVGLLVQLTTFRMGATVRAKLMTCILCVSL